MTSIEIFCLKISDYAEEWLKGKAWLSKIDCYIQEAEKTNNNEQGDRYEGVFAHIKKSDFRVGLCKRMFGSDLEIIDDEEMVFLRRKSARNVFALCLYCQDSNDVKCIGNDYYNKNGEHQVKCSGMISDKMFSGFLQNRKKESEIKGFYSIAVDLKSSIENAFKSEKLEYDCDLVRYDVDIHSEYFFEPDSNYSELFHKRNDLSYQKELRYIVFSNNSNNGFSLNFNKIENSGVVKGKSVYVATITLGR